jgi:hypothetical protein
MAKLNPTKGHEYNTWSLDEMALLNKMVDATGSPDGQYFYVITNRKHLGAARANKSLFKCLVVSNSSDAVLFQPVPDNSDRQFESNLFYFNRCLDVLAGWDVAIHHGGFPAVKVYKSILKKVLSPDSYKATLKLLDSNLTVKPNNGLCQYDVNLTGSNTNIQDKMGYYSTALPNTKINVKGNKTMLNTLMNVNKRAAKTAATQTATRKVSELLTAKLVSVLPAESAAILNGPLGALIVANLAGVALILADDQLDSKTRTIGALVTDAMTVNAMADVLAKIDVTSLIQGVMSIPEVAALGETDAEV